ncbi:hypothetical protein MPSEU_000008200 [Mayamaea pseudoterrestris]|nr:hypothetical protein MPSEU_000008200 [Mayamaea pseudoterrestris]
MESKQDFSSANINEGSAPSILSRSMMRPALLGKLNCGSNHKHADDDYDGLLVGFQSSSSLVDSPRSKQLMTRTVALSSSSTASVHAALSSALTEMNAELRSKTDECQALQETVSKLAMSMHESDVRLEQALMENERLMLKLQAVCFLEKGEVSSSNSVVDAVDEQDLRHGEKPALPLSPPRQESIHVKTKHISATRTYNHGHGNHGRNMILFPELKPTVSKTVTKMDAKQPAMACIITKQTLAKLSAIHDDEIREPVSENHADTTDDKHPSSGQRDAAADQVDGPVDVDAIIPSQTMAAQAPASTIPHAAFVRVLSERDEAHDKSQSGEVKSPNPN